MEVFRVSGNYVMVISTEKPDMGEPRLLTWAEASDERSNEPSEPLLIRHSESPRSHASKMWVVRYGDIRSKNIKILVDKLSPSARRALDKPERWHYKTKKPYRIHCLAIWLDRVPASNGRRLGFMYESCAEGSAQNFRYWFRPLLGNGGFLVPVNNHDRFFTSREELQKWTSRK